MINGARFNLSITAAICLIAANSLGAQVSLVRLPDNGIEPQCAVDASGELHVIYLTGDPMSADIFYVRSRDGGTTFSKPMRVNTNPNSAIATGAVRGPHIALGREGRVHVAWMGSSKAMPRGPGSTTPMLYTRLNDNGDAFEPQRNLIQSKPGLDGGGSIATDQSGHVYVAWHAPASKESESEGDRRVWIVRSDDDGKTFSSETCAFDQPLGACACCALRLFVSTDDNVYALFRSAYEQTNRNIYLLESSDHAKTFRGAEISPLKIGICVMSTSSMAQRGDNVFAAWETHGKVFWSRVDPAGPGIVKTISAGDGDGQKYPSLAIARNGDVLLAWSEGAAWEKPGKLVWRIFDSNGNPKAEPVQTNQQLPVWSFPAAFVRADGEFGILY
jgi:hypothetical protein